MSKITSPNDTHVQQQYFISFCSESFSYFVVSSGSGFLIYFFDVFNEDQTVLPTKLIYLSVGPPLQQLISFCHL